MTDTPRPDEVAEYAAAVRRHLADLPAAVREDLLADLETHLAEVAADLEAGATLAERLGPPEVYASELREAAELEGEREASPLRHRLATARDRAALVADRITGSAGMGTFAECREKLRPGWWVLRGAAAGVLAVVLLLRFDESFMNAAIANYAGTLFFTGVVALLGAWWSMRLGTASTRWRPRPRLALAVGGTLVVAWAAFAAAGAVGFTSYSMLQASNDGYYYDEESSYGGTQDVYPYSADGELLTGVYLLDEYGNPLYIGDPYECSGLHENPFEDPTTEDSYEEPTDAEPTVDLGYQYPLCVPEDGETGPTADPSETPTDLPGTSESAPESPGASADPDGTATTDPTPTEERPTDS
jgi:hypothetical protein